MFQLDSMLNILGESEINEAGLVAEKPIFNLLIHFPGKYTRCSFFKDFIFLRAVHGS